MIILIKLDIFSVSADGFVSRVAISDKQSLNK
jgi:hypothetical protein